MGGGGHQGFLLQRDQLSELGGALVASAVRYAVYLTFTQACSALRTVVTVCTPICPGSQFFQGQTVVSITLLGFLKGLVGKSECVSVCMCV